MDQLRPTICDDKKEWCSMRVIIYISNPSGHPATGGRRRKMIIGDSIRDKMNLDSKFHLISNFWTVISSKGIIFKPTDIEIKKW